MIKLVKLGNDQLVETLSLVSLQLDASEKDIKLPAWRLPVSLTGVLIGGVQLAFLYFLRRVRLYFEKVPNPFFRVPDSYAAER